MMVALVSKCRFFEGTPKDAYNALEKLIKLAGATECFVGHNYTASNLKFAQHVGELHYFHLLEIFSTVSLILMSIGACLICV